MSRKNKTLRKVKCLHCGYEWFPRKPGRPARCPARGCGSPYWDLLPEDSPHRGKAGKVLILADEDKIESKVLRIRSE